MREGVLVDPSEEVGDERVGNLGVGRLERVEPFGDHFESFERVGRHVAVDGLQEERQNADEVSPL